MSQLQRRKALMQKAEQRKHLTPVIDESLIQSHLQSEIKNYSAHTQMMQHPKSNLVSFENMTADEILILIEKQFDTHKKEELLNSCKQTVLDNMIKPFGLGAILFSGSDKDGGNVTTLHNFNKGITATAADQASYDNYKARNEKGDFSKERSAYDGKEFKAKRKAILQQEDPLIDAYTGKEIPKDGRSQLDHIVSAHEIHQDTKNYLYMSDQERANMSINDKNLAMTNASLNQSKGDAKMEDFLDTQVKGQDQKNVDRFGINKEMAMQKDKEARAYIKQTQLKGQIKKQGKELITTSFSEAKKMGMQQMLGAILYDFVDAAFNEIKDFLQNDVKDIKSGELINQLKTRLGRIANKIINKWQYYLHVFKEGFLSGLLSNIVTFIINTFITTAKNIVRIIREGFLSIIKAVKIVVSPSPDMTKAMACDAAVKLITGSIITTIGILGTEAISKALGPIPFVDLISNVIGGLLTGVATCIVTFLLDKIDIFNLNHEAKHQFIIEQLTNIEKEAERLADYYYSKAMGTSIELT